MFWNNKNMNQRQPFNAAESANWINHTRNANAATDTNLTALLYETLERFEVTPQTYWDLYKQLRTLDYKEENLPFSCRFLWAKISGFDITKSADVVALMQLAPSGLALKNAEVFYKLQSYTKSTIDKNTYKAFENLVGVSNIKWNVFPIMCLDKSIISEVLISYLDEQQQKYEDLGWSYNIKTLNYEHTRKIPAESKMEPSALRTLVVNAPDINWIKSVKRTDAFIQITEALVHKDLSKITKKESDKLSSFFKITSSITAASDTSTLQKHYASRSALLKKISENKINHNWLEALFFKKDTVHADMAVLFENKEIAAAIKASDKLKKIEDYMFRPYLSDTEINGLLEKKDLTTIASFINNQFYRVLPYFKPYLLTEAYLKKDQLTDKEKKRVADVCGQQFKDISFKTELRSFNIAVEALDLIGAFNDAVQYVKRQTNACIAIPDIPSCLPEI